jgi:hypothetical protein
MVTVIVSISLKDQTSSLPEWDVYGSTGRGNFDVRWNDGLPAADCVPHRLSHPGMNDRSRVLDVACRTHYCRFAVRDRSRPQRAKRGSNRKIT